MADDALLATETSKEDSDTEPRGGDHNTRKIPAILGRTHSQLRNPPLLVGTQIMVIINWLQPKLSQAVIMAQVAKS